MSVTEKVQKVAIVTGGSGGIGSEVSRRLARNGIAVVVGYSKNEQKAYEVARNIESGGGVATAMRADVAHNDQIDVMFAKTIEKYGRVDYLINNAGSIAPGPITDVTEEIFDKVFDVNARGAFLMLKAAAKHIQSNGRIVNISSTMVGDPIAGGSLYAASKAALEIFGQVLAKELGSRSVTVNTLRLGPVIPGMFAKAPPERQAALAAASPFKRLGTPNDVSGVIAFLLSDDASWITGQVLTVDGGAT